MWKRNDKRRKCSVIGCSDQHKSLHLLPALDDLRAQWIKFIFDGDVPADVTVGRKVYVCANHFGCDCFTNLGQYKAGLAKNLFLKRGSVPTVRDKTADVGNGGDDASRVPLPGLYPSKAAFEDRMRRRGRAKAVPVRRLLQMRRIRTTQQQTPDPTPPPDVSQNAFQSGWIFFQKERMVLPTAGNYTFGLNQEMLFCTPLSSSVMQAGVCLRQDSETTLPELQHSAVTTEQHTIGQKEEGLDGLESVHTAESETKCAAQGLDTLEPECVTAHSGVSDVPDADTSLVKTETDAGSAHTGDIIKTENLDGAEMGHEIHLHPDQIKTETEDHGFHNPEHIGDLQDFKDVDIKTESSECLMGDLMDTGTDQKDHSAPWQHTCERSQNCKKEETDDLLTQCEDFKQDCDTNDENLTRIIHKSANGSRKGTSTRRTDSIIEPEVNSSENSSLFQTEPLQKNEGEFHTGGRPFKCTMCEKSFTTKSILNIHLRIHTGEKPHKCIHCGKCFSQISALNCHLRIHTGEKPFKCSHCGKCFSQISSLNCHLRIHTGKPYKCPWCDRVLNAKSAFNTHVRIHTGEKPYKCTQCEMRFKGKYDLNTHLRTHTGEKPYQCTRCGKCLSSMYQLNCHWNIHTGEKPYKCTQCEKSFNTKSLLNAHLRIHTGEKPYKCIHCEKCFSQICNLRRHLRIHLREKH